MSKDHVTQVADDIITAFKEGRVPAALAKVFITTEDLGISGGTGNRPCDKWSWGNRLIIALRGHTDARGYRQWQQAGRSVIKGSRACWILAPMITKRREPNERTGEMEVVPAVVGFKGVPVFGYSQTEPIGGDGDTNNTTDTTTTTTDTATDPTTSFIDSLPLIEVARSWNIDVSMFEARSGAYLGATDSDTYIKIGVKNLSTWAHELIHVADAKATGNKLKPGQHADQEVVAELGGAILLECIGCDSDSDRGGCLDYVKRYTKEGSYSKAIRLCNELVERACNAVRLVLDARETVNETVNETEAHQ